MAHKCLKFISIYSIYRDGKEIQNNIKTWQEALKQARKWQNDLFNNPRKIEILNIWTGEIISIEEAERRAAKICANSLRGAVIPK